VYKRARFTVGKYESRKGRILRVGMIMLVGLDVVRMVVVVVVSAGGCQGIEQNASECQCG
jgi:hypothetical protein